jgi:hypothetical protein
MFQLIKNMRTIINTKMNTSIGNTSQNMEKFRGIFGYGATMLGLLGLSTANLERRFQCEKEAREREYQRDKEAREREFQCEKEARERDRQREKEMFDYKLKCENDARERERYINTEALKYKHKCEKEMFDHQQKWWWQR